jgi:hypothetical protein
MYKPILSAPNQLLLLQHTEAQYAKAQISRDFRLRTDEETPVIRFLPSKNPRLLEYNPISMIDRNNVDEETVSTQRNITTMLNYAGNLFTPPFIGVCGVDLITPIAGTVNFGGYLHCLEGDINIRIHQSTRLDVYCQGNNGVFYNGHKIKKQQRVDPFDEYILERKLAEPSNVEILAKVKHSSNWISFIDVIRCMNRLYLLADKGNVTVEFIEDDFKSPNSRRDCAGRY